SQHQRIYHLPRRHEHQSSRTSRRRHDFSFSAQYRAQITDNYIMAAVKLEELIHQMENYLECWKQFNQYIVQGRGKSFEPEDETQFLEVKSVLTQELELILASVQTQNPSKDDI